MRTPVAILIVVVLVIILIPGVAAGASLALENQDSFCASCHTQPEVKYYQQSLQAQATTLASFHTQKQMRCIDCHTSHTDGQANFGFMTAGPVEQVCNNCHRGLNERE